MPRKAQLSNKDDTSSSNNEVSSDHEWSDAISDLETNSLNEIEKPESSSTAQSSNDSKQPLFQSTTKSEDGECPENVKNNCSKSSGELNKQPSGNCSKANNKISKSCGGSSGPSSKSYGESSGQLSKSYGKVNKQSSYDHGESSDQSSDDYDDACMQSSKCSGKVSNQSSKSSSKANKHSSKGFDSSRQPPYDRGESSRQSSSNVETRGHSSKRNGKASGQSHKDSDSTLQSSYDYSESTGHSYANYGESSGQSSVESSPRKGRSLYYNQYFDNFMKSSLISEEHSRAVLDSLDTRVNDLQVRLNQLPDYSDSEEEYVYESREPSVERADKATQTVEKFDKATQTDFPIRRRFRFPKSHRRNSSQPKKIPKKSPKKAGNKNKVAQSRQKRLNETVYPSAVVLPNRTRNQTKLPQQKQTSPNKENRLKPSQPPEKENPAPKKHHAKYHKNRRSDDKATNDSGSPSTSTSHCDKDDERVRNSPSDSAATPTSNPNFLPLPRHSNRLRSTLDSRNYDGDVSNSSLEDPEKNKLSDSSIRNDYNLRHGTQIRDCSVVVARITTASNSDESKSRNSKPKKCSNRAVDPPMANQNPGTPIAPTRKRSQTQSPVKKASKKLDLDKKTTNEKKSSKKEKKPLRNSIKTSDGGKLKVMNRKRSKQDESSQKKKSKAESI